MPVNRRTAAWTIPAFAAAGILGAVAQFASHPYWFASPGDRLSYGLLLALFYGALGVIFAIPFGLIAGGVLRRRGGEALAASLLTALFWTAFWFHYFKVKGLFNVRGIVASAVMLLFAACALLLIGRRPPGRPMERRIVAAGGIVILALFGAGVFAGERSGAAGRGPNVLLLVVDTLRADHLACYGHPRGTSPAIDRVAREGVLFPDAVSPAPFTQPGIAALLTGSLPSRIGVINHPNRLEERWLTLAEAFGAAGYRTGFANSHPLLTPAWGFAQGFDEYRYLHRPVRFDDSLLGRMLGRLGLRDLDVGYRANRVTDFAIRLLERKSGRPFFVYAHYLDPHYPYKPPAPYDRMFAPDGEEKARLLDERLPDGRRRIFGLRPSPGELEASFALYDGEVAFTDREIGRLLASLDSLGLRENTIVAITSDHGESLGEQDLWFAHTHLLYDPTQRVPLVLRYPERLPAGVLSPRQVALIDLAPALLRLAGVPAESEMDGRVPAVVEGRADETDRPAFAENGRTVVGSGEQENPRWLVPGDEGKWRMVRLGDWKLIRIPAPEGALFELYDLAADPGETTNLAGSRPDVVANLTPLIDDWLASIEEGETAELVVDQETLEGLRALGYIR
ncbi:MAG: sulfatase [Candidatus Eisenbacteria bacterium]